MPTERLHKALAHAGVASRRAAEELIRAGRVRVNGSRVDEVGAQVDREHDRLEVDGRVVHPDASRHVYVLLHKPVGVVTTAADPEGRPTVLDLVTGTRRIYPVGRLDADSEGLLLLTDDGDLTYRLTQARYEVEKEYHALVRSVVRGEQLRHLRDGVLLDDGPARAIRAEVLGRAPEGTWVRMVLHEGRKHEVRRMLAAVGCPVLRLIRERVGPLRLGDLAAGEHRPLRGAEVTALRRSVGLGGRDDRSS